MSSSNCDSNHGEPEQRGNNNQDKVEEIISIYNKYRNIEDTLHICSMSEQIVNISYTFLLGSAACLSLMAINSDSVLKIVDPTALKSSYRFLFYSCMAGMIVKFLSLFIKIAESSCISSTNKRRSTEYRKLLDDETIDRAIEESIPKTVRVLVKIIILSKSNKCVHQERMAIVLNLTLAVYILSISQFVLLFIFGIIFYNGLQL